MSAHLLLLLHLGFDELWMSPVPITQRCSSCGAARLAAGFSLHWLLVIDLQERRTNGPLGRPPPLSFSLPERMGERSVPVPEPNLKSYGLAVGQVHDGLHVILHRLDEAGAALRILILRFRPLCPAGLGSQKPVAATGGVADVILVVQADVEPHRVN